ncbi:MAG: hypothetical protein EXX96DRAFT_491175 [Benjaminiella poitrasii]|nr:MAG: hypothetical protein EXX96DRAFT_491175 [Benjaminiella poitrasii]
MLKSFKLLPSLLTATNSTKKTFSKRNLHLSIKRPKKEDRFTNLPVELLVCIYQRLGTKECTRQFSFVCRAFHDVAIQPTSKAAWIVHHFGRRFALYYALLSFPERCHSQWVKTLFHMGALVPRHLLQCLVQVYGKNIAMSDEVISSILEGSFFARQIQHLPFDGYVIILQEGYQKYPDLDLQTNDVAAFMSCVSSFNHDFFPAPIIEKSMQHGAAAMMLKLFSLNADTISSITLMPLFEFDPVVRANAWEAVLLVLFNEAFRPTSTNLKPDRERQLKRILESLATPYSADVKEQTIFCHIFSYFFTKYPAGYCHQRIMNKLLTMLRTYLSNQFPIDTALATIVNQRSGRSDIVESIDYFLKESPSL